jgi:hypothetical protein
MNNIQWSVSFIIEALTLNYDTGKMKIYYEDINYSASIFIAAAWDINEI